MVLKRTKHRIFIRVSLTFTLLVIVSWPSFIVNRLVVLGWMGVVLKILLLLPNIFIGVKKWRTYVKRSLNAVGVFFASCTGGAFHSFLEYAMVWQGCRIQTELISSTLGTSNNISEEKMNQNIFCKNAYKHVVLDVQRISCTTYS